eukprot:scaffold527_cov368-Prasinococcus_capsulatus_cf.AAC.52
MGRSHAVQDQTYTLVSEELFRLLFPPRLGSLLIQEYFYRLSLVVESVIGPQPPCVLALRLRAGGREDNSTCRFC